MLCPLLPHDADSTYDPTSLQRRIRMSPTNCSASVLEDSEVSAAPQTKSKKGSSRRAFLSRVGGAAATIAAGAALAQGAQAASNSGNATQDFGRSQGPASADSAVFGRARAVQAFNNRVSAAQAELSVRTPNEVTNGDEQRFPNFIGNYSKGLAHNGIGEVLPSSYASFLRAVNSGSLGAVRSDSDGRNGSVDRPAVRLGL